MSIMKRIVGLTGTIGSGKSTASAYLAGLGAAVLDADGISRAALQKDGGCYTKCVEAFGTDILLADGTVNRKKLAAIVFSDDEKRLLLNGIIHPYVCERMLEEAGKSLEIHPERPVILDVPLLIECGLYRQTDWNVLVYADDEVRIRRVMARDGCTREEVLARMRTQMPQEERKKYCQTVLDNSGTLEDLYRQTEELYRLLTEK